ncbi:MAG: AsnC family transcriptional regulator [Eubacteriales bacterium]
MTMLDETDRQLLNIVQNRLPVVAEPYRTLAEELNVTEEEIIKRLGRLKDAGIIRRLGAVFDSRRVGYKGTLCALKAPPERISEVAAVINSFRGVTHNYLRAHEFNMWFTVLAESQDKLDQTIKNIRELTGLKEFLSLPAENVFKIGVHFRIT